MTAAKIRPDTEMCLPAVGPLMAYAGQRAADRYGIDGELRHAVTEWALICGALDAECGKRGVVEVGPWDPEDPLNCLRCVQFVLGKRPMPADPPPALVVPTVPVQLALLEDIGPRVPRRPRPVPLPHRVVAVDQFDILASA